MMKTVRAIVGIAFMAVVVLGDTHSASVNVTVDTRTVAVSSLTISGTNSVTGGNSATYTCTTLYADGSQADVSSLCTWSFVGTVPSGTYLYGSQLQTALTLFPQSVQIRAAYKRPEGQVSSLPFTVNISGGRLETMLGNVSAVSTVAGVWDLNASATTIGASGAVQCKWYLDGTLLSGQTGSHLTAYRVTGATGSRKLRVEVTDDQSRIAEDEASIAFNKPLAANQIHLDRPAYDPAGFFLSMPDDNRTMFAFNAERRNGGLVIIAHGLRDSVQSDWLPDMGQKIIQRCDAAGIVPPNIALLDWSELAGDPSELPAWQKSLLEWLMKSGNKKAKYTAATGYAINYGFDLYWVKEFGLLTGQQLANWIYLNSKRSDSQIDKDKPIHLIGHSAGGFVAGEASRILKTLKAPYSPVYVDRVTMLDTPFACVNHLKSGGQNFPNPGYVERYISSNFGVLDTLFSAYPDPHAWYHYQILESFYGVFSQWATDDSGHGFSHVWFRETIADPSRAWDGFALSPIINVSTRIEKPIPVMAARAASMTEIEGLPDFVPAGWQIFGDTIESSGVWTLTEENDAGMWADITIPVATDALCFEFNFSQAGDGDFLAVNFADLPVLYRGIDQEISRDTWMPVEIPLDMVPAIDGKLVFTLVSRGNMNAKIQIKNIRITQTEDPDQDGLNNDEESLLQTNPRQWDTDGDGLSDFAEVRNYFTDPILTDSDGDGMGDAEELAAGSNPNDPDSCFIVTSLTPLPTGGMRVTWQGKIGRHYRVNRCEQLGTGVYATLATGVTGVEPLSSFDDTQGSSRAFYWVELEP